MPALFLCPEFPFGFDTALIQEGSQTTETGRTGRRRKTMQFHPESPEALRLRAWMRAFDRALDRLLLDATALRAAGVEPGDFLDEYAQLRFEVLLWVLEAERHTRERRRAEAPERKRIHNGGRQ